MNTKTILTAVVAAVLVALLPQPAHAAFYSLVKASISLPGYIDTVDGVGNNILVKRTLNTNAIINLARGLPIKTKPNKNWVLVGAAEAGNLQAGSAATAVRLLVVDITNPQGTYIELLKPDSTTTFVFAENHISSAFLRVGVGRAEVIANGSIVGGTKVQTAATLKRKSTPDGPLPIISSSFSGQFTFKDDDNATKTGYVLAGKWSCSGKILGSVSF